jgi:hypothetical protein
MRVPRWDLVLRRVLLPLLLALAAGPARAATIAVTTTAESPGAAGDCTIGEAIEAANTDAAVDGCAAGSGADAVMLPAGTYKLTSGSTTAAGVSAFVVTSQITVLGAGSTVTLAAGVTNLRFFEVTTAGTLTLEGLTLLGGIASGPNGIVTGPFPGSPRTPGGPGRGGAIHNGGELTLRDVLLKQNQAIGGNGVAGGSMSGGPSGSDGGAGQGGAVYNAGGLTSERTTFLQNDAIGGRGGSSSFEAGPGIGGAAEGGGIHNVTAGTVSAIDSVFTANRAIGGMTGFSGTSGLSPDPGGPADGGGIFSRGVVVLTRTEMNWHQAVGGVANAPGAGRGGAVAILAGSLTVSRGSFTDNNATGGMQPGLYPPRPTGSALGGGLYLQSATADVQGVAIARNTVAPGPKWPDIPATLGTARGGGVALAGTSLAVRNTTFTANFAPDGGGGVHADAASTLTMQYATVAQNSSTGIAGGLVVSGTTAVGATILAHNGGGNCQGPVGDLGSNIQYPDATCNAAFLVTDPMLGPREESAGTIYHPLLPGSPARDSSANPCPAEDQRGAPRPVDGDGDTIAICDRGAIEADSTVPPTDVIFEDGFEAGDLTAWSGSSTDGGDLAVAADAALAGTYGLRATVDDTAPLYVLDETPADEARYRARFRFDPSAFDPGTASGTFRTRIFIAFDDSPQRRLFALVLRKQSDVYSLMVRTRLDDNSHADTGFFPISAGAHSVEIDWRRASGPDANDGGLQLWIDGASVAQLTALDNASGGIDFARLGALSVKAGASGPLDFDAFESRRQTYIGP